MRALLFGFDPRSIRRFYEAFKFWLSVSTKVSIVLVIVLQMHAPIVTSLASLTFQMTIDSWSTSQWTSIKEMVLSCNNRKRFVQIYLFLGKFSSWYHVNVNISHAELHLWWHPSMIGADKHKFHDLFLTPRKNNGHRSAAHVPWALLLGTSGWQVRPRDEDKQVLFLVFAVWFHTGGNSKRYCRFSVYSMHRRGQKNGFPSPYITKCPN